MSLSDRSCVFGASTAHLDLKDATLIPAIRQRVPWWLRIGLKIVLARLPIPYSVWKRLRLFEHGEMDKPQRALNGFIEYSRIGRILRDQTGIPTVFAATDLVVLELGPGDSLFTAIIAKSLNASRVWLVDAGKFATLDFGSYTSLISLMRQIGFATRFADGITSIDSLLRICNCEYLTQGTSSLKCIQSESVDFCFSNAVLASIRKNDFITTLNELYRILKQDGVCVHRVDLTDHMGGGLNNLRFSDAIWEGRLFSQSGFYTNRIRFQEMLDLFVQAGFKYHLSTISRWTALPLSRAVLDEAFRDFEEQDLLVSGFVVVLRKRTAHS